MPGKPWPQKVIRSGVFPLCPSTDPTTSDHDAPIELQAYAYLSDGNTLFDSSVQSRSNDSSNTAILTQPDPSPDSRIDSLIKLANHNDSIL